MDPVRGLHLKKIRKFNTHHHNQLHKLFIQSFSLTIKTMEITTFSFTLHIFLDFDKNDKHKLKIFHFITNYLFTQVPPTNILIQVCHWIMIETANFFASWSKVRYDLHEYSFLHSPVSILEVLGYFSIIFLFQFTSSVQYKLSYSLYALLVTIHCLHVTS